MKSISEIFNADSSSAASDGKNETNTQTVNTQSAITQATNTQTENTPTDNIQTVNTQTDTIRECDDYVNAREFAAATENPEHFNMNNPADSHGSNEAAAGGKRRMYCPRCYSEFYVYDGICPECGAVLEEPLSEDEAEEFMEMLFSTRL